MLLPWGEIREWWAEWSGTFEEGIQQISRTYHVSTVMVARQLWEHDQMSRQEFFDFYQAESVKWVMQKSAAGGGNYYATAPVRNSRLLTESVLESMGASRTTVREASRLLGVKPRNLSRLQEALAGE